MFKRKLPSEKVLTPDEVLSKLEYFCAYRERSPKEVRMRIAELGLRGRDAEQVYDVLEGDNFFNERRFAEAYAGGKFRMNHWGKVRIRIELRRNDITPDIIAEALDLIDPETYEQSIRELLEKKLLHYAGDTHARDKAAAALIRAGFESELVFRYL